MWMVVWRVVEALVDLIMYVVDYDGMETPVGRGYAPGE